MNKISKAVICRRVVVTPPLRDTSPQSHDLRVVLFSFYIQKSNLLLTTLTHIATAGLAPARHSFNAVFLLIKDLIGKGTNSH
jgi:hypothetical protein